MQRQEVLVGLQVGVVLGDREQLPKSGHERPLGRCLLGRGPGGGRRHRTGLRDVLEDLAFVGGVAPHGLDEVGDEVVSAPELRVDVRPGVPHEVPLRNESVVARDPPEDDQQEHGEQDDQDPHDAGSFPRTWRRCDPGSLVRDGVQREHHLRHVVDERLGRPDELDELRRRDLRSRHQHTVPDDLVIKSSDINRDLRLTA